METQVASQQETLEESGVSVSVEGVPLSYDELSGSGQLLSFFAGKHNIDPGGTHLSVRRQRI